MFVRIQLFIRIHSCTHAIAHVYLQWLLKNEHVCLCNLLFNIKSLCFCQWSRLHSTCIYRHCTYTYTADYNDSVLYACLSCFSAFRGDGGLRCGNQFINNISTIEIIISIFVENSSLNHYLKTPAIEIIIHRGQKRFKILIAITFKMTNIELIDI